MAYCPTYTNPQVKADFNSIVEDYGGKPLSNMEFRSRKLRGERFGKDKFAMDVAYYMWDKHQGNMEQIFADKEGAKYRLSKPTEIHEVVEDIELSLDHLTDAERSYLEAEATIYDPFADEERGYDTRGPVERTMFTEANITKEKYKLPTKKYSNIEESVDILFEHKPELLKIGSKEAYSKYLNTIFPNTLNTNILYHIGGKNITKFDSSMFGKGEGVNALGEGVYFQENAYEIMSAGIGSDYFYESPNPILSMLQDGVLTMAVANIVGNDVYNKTLSVPQEVVIRDVDRIHILGSEQDIKGFKKFVESQEMPTQTIQESFDKISEKYPEIKGLLTENPVFTEDGTLLGQKSFKSSAQEAAYKIMQERVYGKELTQSDIQSINNELLKLSQSIGDTDWSLKVSSKGNYYVAGYKNRGVLFDSYYSPYAEGIFRQQESGTTIGQANLQAGTVLIDMVNGKADTPYHEYAHHFIGWFRNTEIVQEGIKKWGSEEALIQSIGEQALKQKGEAWNWWTRFVNWMQNLFGKMSSLEKQELTNILTDAFLNRIDLETGETLTSERIQELRNQLSGEYIQHQRISEQEAATNILNDIGVEVKKNMTQQDHIDNMMKLRENIAATEVDINEISEETLKKLQLDPDIDKVKRVYANLKTGEIVAEMSTTDKVTIKKLKHTSREELRELTAKYQGDLKSEWGSRNHLTLERFTEYFVSTESFSNIFKNDDTGYNAELLSLKEIHKESKLNAKDSRELQLGIEDMLNWINEMQKDIDPKGKAKILTEQVLVNPKDGTAGTADLVVIFSDGSYGQLDFKTMHPNFNMWGSKTEGGPEVITHPNWIHMNRKEEFRIQLMTNNHTLEDVYGLGKRRFSRVIPIAVRLGWNAKEGVNTDNVTQLRMARSNRESQNLYGVEMLPLALGEKIGIKELDAEMNKLYDVFQNKQIELSTMSVSNPKFSLLKQEVENLDRAINSAIIRKDLYYLRKDIKRLINLYHEKFEGLKDIDSEYVDGRPNPSFLETGEITELRHMIEVYQTILATSGNYFREFKLDETNQKEFLAYTEELGELSSILSMMDLALREKMVERSMDNIDMERLKDSLDPSFTQANFREGSEQMHAVTQKFMTEVLKANDMRRIDRQRVEKKIISAKNNFEKWASSKGMSLQEGYNSILTEKTANFASQFTHEFWEDMDKAMKTKDNKWLNEHFQLREDAEEVYKTNRQNFINRGYTAEEVTRWEENNQIEDAKYNPRRWRMYYEIKDRLPTEYYTEQYGELLKPGNEPALEFYHTMLDFMKEAKSMMGIGYAEGIPYNLLPNIRADLLQQFLDYGFNFDYVKEIFTSNFNTRPDDIHFGSTMNLTRRVNPITGEFLPEVPILYTTPIRNKKGEIDNTLKSRDIAKSVLIFYDMALNYKYMTEKVEPYVEAWRDLIAIEGNRAMTEGGKNILTPTEEQHRIGGHKTRALETFNNLVDYHVYGIRIPSSGVSRKQQKTIMSLKSWHAKKELAFAPIAQIGNFTQIRAGAFFTGLAGFHYTTRQFRRSSNMRMRKNELYRALVQFIEPSPGRAGIVTKNIASRKVSKIVNWDTAFWGFRKGEETVNDDVLVAMMMNYGFDENGNIRRLKRLPEGTKSLFENSRIEDGRIVIDGIIDNEGTVNYDAYTALRRLVKGVGTDIKGQPDSQNPQGINLKLWGNTMMQYKGWMPGMVYARLGDIHYSPDRQTLVEGKFRSLMSDLKSDTEKSIAGFIFTEALPRLIQFTALMPVMMVAGKGYSINKARAEMDFKRFQAKFPNDPYIKELNFDDFLDYRQSQIRSLAAELTTILSLIAMILAMSASWKDDDDPWFSQNYLTRTTFRLVHRAKREIAFMVDFNSWTNTFLQTPMPILGYITDLTRLWSSTMDQIGDDIKGKDVERDGLAGALYGRNIGGSARDKKGRFYETMRWGPLNKTFKFFETHTAHRESIY